MGEGDKEWDFSCVKVDALQLSRDFQFENKASLMQGQKNAF